MPLATLMPSRRPPPDWGEQAGPAPGATGQVRPSFGPRLPAAGRVSEEPAAFVGPVDTMAVHGLPGGWRRRAGALRVAAQGGLPHEIAPVGDHGDVAGPSP